MYSGVYIPGRPRLVPDELSGEHLRSVSHKHPMLPRGCFYYLPPRILDSGLRVIYLQLQIQHAELGFHDEVPSTDRLLNTKTKMTDVAQGRVSKLIAYGV